MTRLPPKRSPSQPEAGMKTARLTRKAIENAVHGRGAHTEVSPDSRQGHVDDRDVHDAHEHRGDEDGPDRYLLADARGHSFLSPRPSIRCGSGIRIFPPGYKIIGAAEIPAATHREAGPAARPPPDRRGRGAGRAGPRAGGERGARQLPERAVRRLAGAGPDPAGRDKCRRGRDGCLSAAPPERRPCVKGHGHRPGDRAHAGITLPLTGQGRCGLGGESAADIAAEVISLTGWTAS